MLTDAKTRRAIMAGRITPTMTFSQKIWAITRRIPRGKVTTYRHLAAALGTRASRAVGNAMNKNPFAPEVPCHRVVGSDGKLVGYAGGLDKKRKMLAAEGVAIHGDRVDPQAIICIK